MNYVTTNIRLPEEDYLRLKAEAAKRRESLAAVIRRKIATPKPNTRVVKNLLGLVEKAEKEHWRGPADLAKNHDEYFIK
ncbi:MAG: hypothetical protein V1808_04335 [Candidatus Daviesbacteria bacterium]